LHRRRLPVTHLRITACLILSSYAKQIRATAGKLKMH